MRKVYFLLLSGGLIFSSCERDTNLNQADELTLPATHIPSTNSMKDFSKLLGSILKEKENREFLVSLIKDRNDNSEAITINAFLGRNISNEELKLLDNSYHLGKTISANSVKKSISRELLDNLDQYPFIKARFKEKNLDNTGKNVDAVYEEYLEFYANQNLDIYFPYEENFDLSKEHEVTLTWDPLTDQDWNEGFISDIDGDFELVPIDNITDDYAYENATLVVRQAGFIGSEIVTDRSFYTPVQNNPPSWQFQGWQGFLTFNVDHTKIKEDDVLKVIIPKIRMMEHLATVFTPTTITITRSSANLVTDANNNLVFPLSSDSKLLATKFNIKRKDARNQRWVDTNILWDDDWDMHEVDHNLTWASHHTFSGSLNINGNVKLGYDVVKKEVTFEGKLDAPFSVRVGGNCRLEYNNNISRRAVLTQVVGDGGFGVYNDNGTLYAIRSAGKMQYYLKPYLTKIVQ